MFKYFNTWLRYSIFSEIYLTFELFVKFENFETPQ